jgi:hypothetical protein
VRQIQALPDEPGYAVVIDDAGDRVDTRRLWNLCVCRPGAEPIELLEEHGMVSRLLDEPSSLLD